MRVKLNPVLRDAISAFQRWNYRGGRPSWTARVSNRVSAIAFAMGVGPRHAATLEIRGRTTGRTISLPVVVADYSGCRYLVAMLGQRTRWARNVRADGRGVLVMRRKRESVSLVEDFSDDRAAVLRRYLELAPGARPFFPVDRRSPLSDFQRIVDDYPVFRVL